MANVKNNLTKAQKAAILLMSLPPQVAVEVMKELNDEEIQKVLAYATSISGITLKDVEDIGREFINEFQTTEFLKVDVESLIEFAEKILPPEKAVKLREFLSSSNVIESLQELEKVDTRVLANLLKNEHPQTIAVVLSQLTATKAADVLNLLPDELKSEVIKRLATIENISPEFMSDLVEALAEEIKGMGVVGFAHKREGLGIAAELLNLLSKETTNKILSSIEGEDPYLAEKLKEKMFTFEDIRKLDNRAIVEVLKSVDKNLLIIALKGAPDDIKEKFLSNMSKRAAEIIKEDMEALGPVKVSEVEKAQKEIVAIIRKLADEGKIDLSGGEAYV